MKAPGSGESRYGMRKWTRVLLVGLLVIVVAYVTRQHSLPRVGQWLDVGEEPVTCDYVMLLNGDRETRPFAVAALYQNGKAKNVLITSARDNNRNTHYPTVHETTHDILTRCGVPDSNITLLDGRCANTFDEAKTLATFARQRPQATFAVVTNNYHTRRSRMVFRSVLGSEMSRVKVVSAETDGFDASNWWHHEDGFVWYLAEYLKSAVYFVRYGNGIAWICVISVLLALGYWCRGARNPEFSAG